MSEAEAGLAGGKKVWVFWLLILLATGLRIANYAADRGLVHDEAADAVNLEHRSYADLRKPLDFWVVAPLGFLYVEKAIGQCLGYSELSLRFFPLLAGIALVPAYLLIADDLFNWPTAWIGALLLGTEQRLIEWSARLKPYGLDALLALITLYIICVGIRRGWPMRYMLLAALWGAITQWFSFPLILVLAGMGSVALIDAIMRREKREVFALLIIAAIWIASFAEQFVLTMHIGSENTGHVDRLWDQYFMPHSWHAVLWIPWAIATIFANTVRLGPWCGIPFLLLIASCILVRQRRSWPIWLAIAPLIPALLAAAINKYPMGDRVLLYIVPLLVMAISACLAELMQRRSANIKILAVTLFLFLFIPDAVLAARRAVHPPKPDDTRQIYAYIVAHRHEGDHVYVAFFAIPSYEYYAPRIGLDRVPAELGTGTAAAPLSRDLAKLSGRVWMISDLLNVDTTDKSFKTLLYFARQRGKELDHIQLAHVEAHLFQLSSDGSTTTPAQRSSAPVPIGGSLP